MAGKLFGGKQAPLFTKGKRPFARGGRSAQPASGTSAPTGAGVMPGMAAKMGTPKTTGAPTQCVGCGKKMSNCSCSPPN